jgi:hypothetical protein
MTTTLEQPLTHENAEAEYKKLSQLAWKLDNFDTPYDFIADHQNFDDLDILLEEYDMEKKSDLTKACILIPNTTPQKLLQQLNKEEEMHVVHTEALNRSHAIIVYFLNTVSDEEIQLLFQNHYVDHYIIQDCH